MTPTVVDAGARGRRAGTGVACLVLLGLTLTAIAHVALHTKWIEVGMALGKANTRHRALLEQKRQLELEIGRLKDPGLVVARASKLGMGPPVEIVPITDAARLLAPPVVPTAPIKPGRKS